jgi:hypothetical protein
VFQIEDAANFPSVDLFDDVSRTKTRFGNRSARLHSGNQHTTLDGVDPHSAGKMGVDIIENSSRQRVDDRFGHMHGSFYPHIEAHQREGFVTEKLILLNPDCFND